MALAALAAAALILIYSGWQSRKAAFPVTAGWVLCGIAAGLLLAGELPMETHDAAELLPAELAIFWTEDGRVCARCDNGTEGSGEDLDAALDDLERAAEGVLFLDTAEHLILCGEPEVQTQG